MHAWLPSMSIMEGNQTQERSSPNEGQEEIHLSQHGSRLQFVFFFFTCGVNGDPVDASVFGLELLQENSHAVAERLQGELAALSPGRQTDRDHWQPILVNHRHLCSHT